MSDAMPIDKNVKHLTYTGRCLCKGVGFTVEGNPNAVYCCYCGDCALGAGGPCQITATYFTPNFALHDAEGLAKRYIVNDTLSGRPKVKCFCSGCGCTIFTIPASDGDEEIVVRTALIENGLELFKPTIECYVRNRPSYFSATATGKQYGLLP